MNRKNDLLYISKLATELCIRHVRCQTEPCDSWLLQLRNLTHSLEVSSAWKNQRMVFIHVEFQPCCVSSKTSRQILITPVTTTIRFVRLSSIRIPHWSSSNPRTTVY